MTSSKKKTPPVPFNEMRRLMSVYGSIKCPRNRRSQNEEATMKVDSIKRKFYRWFPDIDERFNRNEETGCYHPRFGHEFEITYREESRRNDGESLSKKRAKCRKLNKKNKPNNKARKTEKDAMSSPRKQQSRKSNEEVVDVDKTLSSASESAYDPFDNDDFSILSENMLLEESTMEGVFEEVENTFFVLPDVNVDVEPIVQQHNFCFSNLISSSCSSSSSDAYGSEQESTTDSSFSWERDDSTSFEEILEQSIDGSIDKSIDQSIDECCREILESPEDDDNDSVSGYLLDMIST